MRELARQIFGGKVFETKGTARSVSGLLEDHQGSPWKQNEREGGIE